MILYILIILIIMVLISAIVVILNMKKPNKRYSCHVINLDKNITRMKRFYESYSKSDLSSILLTRFKAINGNSIDIRYYVTSDAYNQIMNSEKTGYRQHHYELTKGGVGCFLSHASLYKKLNSDVNNDFYIIFEDDAYIPIKVIKKIEFIIENAPKDWDIILFGSLREVLSEKNMFYDKVKVWWGLFGYAINKRGAKKFLDVYRKNKIDKQIDSMLSLMIIEDDLNVYSPHIHVITHNSDGTDIQLPIQKDPMVNPYMYKNVELFSDF